MKTIETNCYSDLTAVTLKKALEYSVLTRRKGNLTLTIVYCKPYYRLTGLVYLNGRLIADYPQFDKFDNFNFGKIILNKWDEEIFTIEELKMPLKDYQDYRRRDDFINSKLPQGYDHINIFQKDFNEKVKEYPYKSIIGIDYYKDEKIAQRLSDLFLENIRKNEQKMKTDDDYFKDAIDCELANFEVSVSGDPSEALAQLQIVPSSLDPTRLGILNNALKKCYCEAF